MGYVLVDGVNSKLFPSATLSRRFDPAELSKVEAVAEQLRSARERGGAAVHVLLRSGLAGIHAALGEAVQRYNRASADQRARISHEMAKLSRSGRKLRAALAAPRA